MNLIGNLSDGLLVESGGPIQPVDFSPCRFPCRFPRCSSPSASLTCSSYWDAPLDLQCLGFQHLWIWSPSLGAVNWSSLPSINPYDTKIMLCKQLWFRKTFFLTIWSRMITNAAVPIIKKKKKGSLFLGFPFGKILPHDLREHIEEVIDKYQLNSVSPICQFSKSWNNC